MLQHILPCKISAAGTPSALLCFPSKNTAVFLLCMGLSARADPEPPTLQTQIDPRVLQPLSTDAPKATPVCRREVWGACRGLSLSVHRRSFLCVQRTHATTSTASGGGGNIQNQCSPPARAALGAQQEFGCSGRLLNSEARPKKCSLFRPGLSEIIQHKC